MIYEPEHFLIMKHDEVYKVLGGWSGGYLDSDMWRLNSGIIRFVKENDGIYLFYGDSGSVYKVNEKCEGLSFPMADIHGKLLVLGFVNISLKEFELEFTSKLH